MSNDNTYTSPWVYIIAFLLAIHMFTMPFVVYPYLESTGPSWLGLDVSWQMALNYANIKGWTWGKDIIYTYGPLGFLSTKIGWGISGWIFLAFDIFLVINFFYVFKDFLKSSVSKPVGVLILLVISLLVNANHGTDLSWLLLFFCYYWMFKIYKDPSTASFIMLSLITLLAFYIKVNTGLVAVAIFAAHLGLLVFIGRVKMLYALSVFGGLILAIVITSLPLHVNLSGYVKSSLEIIRGYNSIMYLDNNEATAVGHLFTLYRLMLYLFGAYALYLIIKGKFVQLFFVAISVAYVLMLKKQSFLRGDSQHLIEFVCYGPLVLVFGNLLHHKGIAQRYFAGAILLITGLALFYKTEGNTRIDDLYKTRFGYKQQYFGEYKDFNKKPYLFQQDKRSIPMHLLAEIGSNTIDVFPWDIEYLLENKLNYHPRPVFQSFSAYTPALQKINYDFYEKNAPEYILYDYESIDNRYPFADESQLNMFIAKNYIIRDSFVSNERQRLLLKKRSSHPVALEKIEHRSYKIGENILLPAGADLLKIDIAYNNKGKLEAFDMRPPQIEIVFYLADGRELSYKTSPELLKAGVYTRYFMSNLQDFITLLTQKELLIKINHINLRVNPDFVKKDISVEYYKSK